MEVPNGLSSAGATAQQQMLRANLRKLISFLDPFLLDLANAHTVDFIVENLWLRKIPLEIRREADLLGVPATIERLWRSLEAADVNCAEPEPSALGAFIGAAAELCIERLNGARYVDDIFDVLLPDACASSLKEFVRVTEYMSAKKLHEVHVMSGVVACLAEASKSTVVVDIGSGKGYLPSMLALNHQLRILGLDDKPTNIDGALRTAKMLEKKWKVYKRKSLPKREKIEISETSPDSGRGPCYDEKEGPQKTSPKPTVLGISYKQRVELVSCRTNVKKILSEEYPDETDHKILFAGLHTCGNLSPNSLKLFVNCDEKAKSVVNVGCCYHLLDEEFCADPEWYVRRTAHRNSDSDPEFGFPLSDFLRGQKFALGRDARMCGTQNPLKVFKEKELGKATKPLFYRALLQKLLVLKCGPADLPDAIVGRMAHKCDSFADYATKALKKLNVPVQVTPTELDKFESDSHEDWQRLKIFFLLKTALSPVVETVILLDKLLYLFENNIETAFVTRLFDPVVSPRCYAIIASCGNESPIFQ